MKKSLVLVTVMFACLALVGVACAQMCAPVIPPAGKAFQTESQKYTASWKGPKPALERKGPKYECVPFTPKRTVMIPGEPYAYGPIVRNKKVSTEVTVLRDICDGKSKGILITGQKQLCCEDVPHVKWSCKWTTSEVVGKTKIHYEVPPGYDWKEAPKGPVKLTWQADDTPGWGACGSK
jgi:hypothetical protein